MPPMRWNAPGSYAANRSSRTDHLSLTLEGFCMLRLSLLFVCSFWCLSAHGFPAPKAGPKPSRTYAELLVGTWQVTHRHGKETSEIWFTEYAAAGQGRSFSDAGKGGAMTWQYE